MRTLISAALTFVAAGCVMQPLLIPDRDARLAVDSQSVAIAEEAGVRVWADGTAWRSNPYNLPQVMTPVKLTVENRSGKKVRVAYRDLALVGAGGFRYQAIAPLPGQMPVGGGALKIPEIVLADYHPAAPARRPPRFHQRRFYVAPHYRHHYPGYLFWPHIFAYDPGAYGRYAWPAQLPTDDMLAEALPEGVIEDGGRVEGFVYFPAVTRREAHVRFEMQLVDADDGVAFATVTIPLAVLR